MQLNWVRDPESRVARLVLVYLFGFYQPCVDGRLVRPARRADQRAGAACGSPAMANDLTSKLLMTLATVLALLAVTWPYIEKSFSTSDKPCPLVRE